MELASAVAGDPLALLPPLLPVDPEAESWCAAWLAERAAPSAARPLAFIAPGAGWGAKRWPAERYAAVAQGLKERGLQVLVNAPPGEESLAAPIAAAGAAIPFTATLPQLIALTRRIALCIGGDTGPLHLACALGRPVVGIYGPTDPSRNGPFGTRARVLRSPESRRDHTRREAPEPGLLTIAPGRRAARRRRTCCVLRSAPHDQPRRSSKGLAPLRSPAGSAWPGASACRWAFSPRRSISSSSRATPRIRPPWPGAWRWFCPALRCAPTPPAPSKRIANSP